MQHWFLAPYAALGDLGELMGSLPGGRLPEPAARFYAACLLSGLAEMHARRLVHRDVARSGRAWLPPRGPALASHAPSPFCRRP